MAENRRDRPDLSIQANGQEFLTRRTGIVSAFSQVRLNLGLLLIGFR